MVMPRVTRPLVALVVVSLLAAAACSSRLAQPKTPPPPTGPFRTVGGEPTHPRCQAPTRRGDGGTAPRCVVSFGRNPTALAIGAGGTVAVLALMDVQLDHLAAPGADVWP